MLGQRLSRMILLKAVRSVYRIRTVGLENLPREGPALLVSHHGSWRDPLWLSAAQRRLIRFVIDAENDPETWDRAIYRWMGIRSSSGGAAPVPGIEGHEAVRAALDEGALVCVFPERCIIGSGMIGGFDDAFERLLQGSPHPMIPVHVGTGTGKLGSRIIVSFGRPLPAGTPAWSVRLAIQELDAESFGLRNATNRPLASAFIRTARRRWRRPALSDTTGKRLTFGGTLTACVALRNRLADRLQSERHVGVLLPNSVGGVLVNLALTLDRKVPINLNYTSGEEVLRSTQAQAGIGTTITSRAFLARLGFDGGLRGRSLYLEDLAGEIGPLRRGGAWLQARFFPSRCLGSGVKAPPEELATILFSSGSTSRPKGVMLSHSNLMANITSLSRVFPREGRSADHLCGILPFFHSFGLTATMWFPLLHGLTAAYHPNPLEPARIAQLIREEEATLLFSTPTFLTAYIRKARAEDFRTLRYVVVGAEKLKPKMADAFEAKFGIRPLEGYGTTELSPVAALNLPDIPYKRHLQRGAREGGIGRPIPGVAMKVIDPDTREPLPPDEDGLLLVKGPNVMIGYWEDPEKTVQAIREGWYDTGDIARIDREGFVFVTDRLARFSKLGGEMVPHSVVEEVYQSLFDSGPYPVAVTAVPDEQRGERLVVLYTDEAGDPDRLHDRILRSRLPNLWKPSRNAYFKVDRIPLLGSGKLDLKGVRQLALQKTQSTS